MEGLDRLAHVWDVSFSSCLEDLEAATPHDPGRFRSLPADAHYGSAHALRASESSQHPVEHGYSAHPYEGLLLWHFQTSASASRHDQGRHSHLQHRHQSEQGSHPREFVRCPKDVARDTLEVPVRNHHDNNGGQDRCGQARDVGRKGEQ